MDERKDNQISTTLPIDEIKVNEEIRITKPKKVLWDLLYCQLEPMPKELIQIIMSYVALGFEGELTKQFKLPINELINDYVHLAALKNNIAFGSENTLIIVDSEAGTVLQNYNIEEHLLDLTQTDTQFVSAHFPGIINLWSNTGEHKQELNTGSNENERIKSLKGLSNNRIAVVQNNQINIIDLNTFRVISAFEYQQDEHNCWRSPIAFPVQLNQEILLAPTNNLWVSGWDIKTGAQTSDFDAKTNEENVPLGQNRVINYIAKISNNLFLAAIQVDEDSWDIYVFDFAHKQQLKVFNITTPGTKLADLKFHKGVLVAAHANGEFYCYNIHDNENPLTEIFNGRSHNPTYNPDRDIRCTIAPDDERIIQVTRSGLLNIYGNSF